MLTYGQIKSLVTQMMARADHTNARFTALEQKLIAMFVKALQEERAKSVKEAGTLKAQYKQDMASLRTTNKTLTDDLRTQGRKLAAMTKVRIDASYFRISVTAGKKMRMAWTRVVYTTVWHEVT